MASPASSAVHRTQRFLETTGLTRSELARRIGVPRSLVSHVLNGRRRPTLAQAVRLEHLTRVWPEGPIRCSEWVPLEELAVAAA